MSLGDGKRAGEDQGVPFLVDSEAAGILQGALNSMNLGPGKPGPGDEWTFPTEPPDETAEATVDPAQRELPHGPTHKG